MNPKDDGIAMGVSVQSVGKKKRIEKAINIFYYCLFGAFILRVLLVFITDHWDYYQTHDDLDITDFGISFLAGHFNPHWFGYGYFTFLYSSIWTFVGYLWHIIASGWMSLHDYLVFLILEPREILIFNRIGFFIALCMGIILGGYFIKKKTNNFYALLFVSGMLITNSFYYTKSLLKSQPLEVIFVVISLFMADKLYGSLTRIKLVVAGIVLGLIWSTAFTGIFLVGSFFITITIYQINSCINKTITPREGFINIGFITGSFLLSYIITSPYALISFGEWSTNTIKLINQGEMSRFTFDKLPSIQRTLDFIGYNSIFPSVVIVLLFFNFVTDEIRTKSIRYIHPILYTVLCLIIYSTSPHVRIYYFLPHTIVMTILVLIFLFKVENISSRLKILMPLFLLLFTIYTNSNSKVLSSFFAKPDISISQGYEKSNIVQERKWINNNVGTTSLLVFDGWLHYIPKIICSDSILFSDLWEHYRYGRQANETFQQLVSDARRISIAKEGKIFPCTKIWFNYVFDKSRLRILQETISHHYNDSIYYLVPVRWYNQYVGQGIILEENQKPFITYYGDLLDGKLGPLVFRDSDLVIIKLDKSKYLNL